MNHLPPLLGIGARLVQVIETNLATRGAGVINDPIRGLKQYWSPDGLLLAEVDPCPPTDAERFARIVDRWREKRLDGGMSVPDMLKAIAAEIRGVAP